MAIKPISLGSTVEYTLKKDRDSDNPTIFIIGVLDSLSRTKIEDLSMVYRYNPDAPKDSIMESKLNVAEQDFEYVRFGLKGFKNFKDSKGADTPFSTTKKNIGDKEYIVVSDDTLKYIPRYVLRELAGIIARENVESEQERKN